MNSEDRLPELIAIVGPTAVGKTELAVAWAQQINGEIVSADSRQIYRGMDIGTAKPTPAERAQTPHHLIDIRNPDQPFSLAEFHDLALAAIADIQARGRTPLLVGGTGQYLAAVLEGWQIPRVAPQPELRAELEHVAAQEGAAALHARLTAVDPVAARAFRPPTCGGSYAHSKSIWSAANRSRASKSGNRLPFARAQSGCTGHAPNSTPAPMPASNA